FRKLNEEFRTIECFKTITVYDNKRMKVHKNFFLFCPTPRHLTADYFVFWLLIDESFKPPEFRSGKQRSSRLTRIVIGKNDPTNTSDRKATKLIIIEESGPRRRRERQRGHSFRSIIHALSMLPKRNGRSRI
ncbi:hypothetical protein GWI33_009486, partial [Rhynchophorus ferrugineus]